MVDKILKPEHNFEAQIFKMLYKNGKVFILFDGFDEIAPNCAEFVLNLAKSFEFNGGNQLWIATRDYFEVDLKEKLELKNVYKLDSFTKDDGVELIAKNWMFMDLLNMKNIKEKQDFDELLQESAKYQNYRQKAREIVKKIAISEDRSVGMPQLYKMIADVFKDDKDTKFDFKRSEIYSKFVQTLYTRWADEKGQIRKKQALKVKNLI